jgi:uncharacterized membrane protein YcaP (DUF421 family)
MDSVLRGAIIYLILLLLFRATGKRTLAQTTPFDLVLLLIISEAVQNALAGTEYSLIHSVLVVGTLIGMSFIFSQLKEHSERMDRLLDDVPLVVLKDGKMLEERCLRARIDEGDILSSARELQGLERLDEIKYAVLETSGVISIIPKR